MDTTIKKKFKPKQTTTTKYGDIDRRPDGAGMEAGAHSMYRNQTNIHNPTYN